MLGLLLAVALLPDPKLTPGHVMTTDVRTVCERGYSRRVRKVTAATKRAVMVSYGLNPKRRPDLEIDHLIPLSIGGSNDQRNLWPQLARPRPGYPTKDRLEFRLWLDVCAGRVPLEQAQREIARDWILAYRKYMGRKAR